MFTAKEENLRIIAALERALSEIPIGGTRPYKELNSIAGINVQNGRRDLLARAQKAAEKHMNALFASVRGVGIKRLLADETPQVGSVAISSARRKTKKAISRMVGVSSNSMSADARQNTALKLAHLNILHGLADNRKTTSFAAPATSDPFAVKKALGK